MILDFHAHCFPDAIACRAIPQLEEKTGLKTALDGTAASLFASMDRAGIDRAVVQQIATRPGQEPSINQWAAAIQSERMVSFGSFHPDSPGWREELRRLLDLGLPGVKFHPDYQSFFVDEPRMFPIYEALCAAGLIVLFHAGLDLGLGEPIHCRPAGLRKIVDAFPEGRWVAAHLGGYRCWDEVEEHLLGRPLFLDTSYCFADLGPERMAALIRGHGANRILFGTDSPWVDQRRAVVEIKSLGLSLAEEAAVLGGNGAALLGQSVRQDASARGR